MAARNTLMWSVDIKPFTHDQAIFICRQRTDHPEQKLSEFRKFIKKQCHLKKLPTIHQIQQCIKYGNQAQMFIKAAHETFADHKTDNVITKLHGFKE